MLYMCYGVDGPDGPTLRDKVRQKHFEYLEANANILVLGGATLSDNSEDRIGSLLVINVGSRSEAHDFAADEPLRKAGVFREYTVSRMRRGQWYPENAPNSAEGN